MTPRNRQNQQSLVLNNVLTFLNKFNPIIRFVNFVGILLLFLWVAYSFLDVLLRYVFNRPLMGSMEIGELVLVSIVFLGMAYAQLHKSHIRIDLITSGLSEKREAIANAATYIICIAIAIILLWKGIVTARAFVVEGKITAVLSISMAPAAIILPISFALLLIVFLQDLIREIIKARGFGLKASEWFIMVGVPILIILLFFIWMNLPLINLPLLGILTIVILFIFAFLGLPIAFTLVMLAIVFFPYITDMTAGLNMVGRALYFNISDYDWSVVALFILMGFFIVVSGLGSDAYKTAYQWVGHLSGGLAIATIGGSAGVAAVVGDPAAATATIATVALPEMKKYRYSDKLAAGVVAAGATLGPMIPPSIGFIIYGVLAGESIGKLFIAGIIPGLLLAVSFSVAVYIRCRRNPQLGPKGEKTDWGVRMNSLKLSAPIILLFILIIGGIYAGAFSAIEGGGMGAFLAFLIALAMKRMNWQRFKMALYEAGKLITAVLFLIGTAVMFGHVLALSNLTHILKDFITGLPVSPSAVVAVILLMYLVLGFIMDTPIVLLLTVPILAPVVKALGIDLIWFGVLVILMANLGFITPPYGMGIFLLRGISRDIPAKTIFSGVTPFVVGTLVVAVLIFFIPQLATWLPNLMK